MANVGDRVLGQWEPEWFYPAIVVDAMGNSVSIFYDDGASVTLRPDQVKPLSLAVGSRVYGNWKGGGQYYPGRIASMVGHAIVVDYDDGDRETTTVGRLRIAASDA